MVRVRHKLSDPGTQKSTEKGRNILIHRSFSRVVAIIGSANAFVAFLDVTMAILVC